MKDYFSMDSFNRDSTYCCNAVSSQTAMPRKYVDLEGLKAYDDIAVSRDISADEDIVWTPQVLVINNRDTEKGHIVCPWCKNSMYVAERQNSAMGMVMTKKYFSTIEGEDYDEVKYEVKNGRGITQVR